MLRTESLSNALIITRREIKDTLRDWRIVFPILILTLIFPWLMNFTANVAMDFVRQYNAPLIGTRLVPFLMLVVGFFPISFSLVIALETFVGEKERNSLEPLLSTPISDGELYLGKTLAALIPPLIASALGISVYLAGLYFTMHYRPEPLLLFQMWLLTAAEALVMVSGAVIISSQTTSVRAANLLASFIILPMAFLVQAEAILFFWGGGAALWVVLTGLLVVDVILVRTGVRIFNREEILGREIDSIDLRGVWHRYQASFMRGPSGTDWANQPFSLARVYGRDLPYLIRQAYPALIVVLVGLVGAMIIGWSYSSVYRLPSGSIDLSHVTLETFTTAPPVPMMPSIRTDSIFLHNARSLILSAVLAPFSFGALSIVLLVLPMTLVGWLMGQAAYLGFNPFVFSAAFFLPHGILEVPAAVLSTAFAVRIGVSLMSPSDKVGVGHGFIVAVADYCKVFLFAVVPLLLMAAFVEANITPRIIVWALGG